MFPQSWFSQPAAKVTGLRVVLVTDTLQGQVAVYGAGVGVLARKIWLALNRC